jgi:acyl-CoA dehydrogenase
MDFDLTHEQRQILEYGDVIAQKFDRKYWMDCAEKHVFPEALYRQVAEDGFVGTMVPEEYGGAGQGMIEMHLFLEGLSNNGIPLLNLVVGAAMSLGFIAKHGSEQQKTRYLPDACSGKTRFCFAITEPDAGSNTIRTSTMAKKRGNRFALNGQKTFITDADGSDYALVVTRTIAHTEVQKKTDGFTLFIVDLKAKGVQKQYIPVSIPAPETQWQVFFDDVDLGPEDVIGEVDKGFGILFKSLNPERILVGSICCGLGRYALNRAVEYARERKVFNNVIPDDDEGGVDFRPGPRGRRIRQHGKARRRRCGNQGRRHRAAMLRRQRLYQGIWHLRYLSAGAAAEDSTPQPRNDSQLHRRARDGLAAQLLAINRKRENRLSGTMMLRQQGHPQWP